MFPSDYTPSFLPAAENKTLISRVYILDLDSEWHSFDWMNIFILCIKSFLFFCIGCLLGGRQRDCWLCMADIPERSRTSVWNKPLKGNILGISGGVFSGSRNPTKHASNGIKSSNYFSLNPLSCS